MRTITVSFLLITTLFCSCQENRKYSDQLNTADVFIHALHNNDTLQIKSLLGVDPERIGEDMEHFKFKVRGAIMLAQQNIWPDKTSFEIKEYPKNGADLIDVTVPFYKKGSKEEQGKIIMRFVKFLPASKIAFFQVDGKFIDKETIGPSKTL